MATQVMQLRSQLQEASKELQRKEEMVLELRRQAADGTYEWAVVMGGEPSVKWDDGCTTKEEGTNGAGLWLFSRTPTASKKAMAAMHELLKSKGIARSRLHAVPHAKCKYDGAFIK